MKRLRILVILAAFALIVAACSSSDSDDTTTTTAAAGGGEETTTTAAAGGGEETTTTAAAGGGEDNPLADFGESTDADPALVAKALGPVEPSDEGSWNIILASIARANQDLDQATIDKALECLNNQQCDTGTGGEVVMGFADGGGDTVNVWRAVSHMEAILQALTYPEIGSIISTEANFDPDPNVAANDIRFLINSGVDFIVGYPDAGIAIADAIREADAAGIPYASFSAGWVGLPDQDGALVPGEDYLTVVGEDLCELGESFAAVINDGVGTGQAAVLGGTPGNALSLGWQRCIFPAFGEGIEAVNPAPNENTTTGDTFWYDPVIPDVYRGLLTTNPEIRGWAYEYSDGMNTGLTVYDELGIPVENLTVALRTDEQTLFCDWVERNEPTYKIFYSAGGNFQSRVAVTASMLALQDASVVPAEIVVPHVMREVTAADCNPDRPNPYVSGTSLVPDSVLELMFAG
jgi:ribose transport system substrate-binding protein